jgi:hypothetical protein
MDALQSASYKLAEKMYAGAQGAQSGQARSGPEMGAEAGGQSEAGPGGEEVVDADYEVVDED